MTDRAFEHLARFGYAARGVVYVIVGALAVLAALGRGQGTPDSRDALTTLLRTPYGGVVLGLVALGLVCFALWRLAQAALDADHLGTDPKALVRRAGFAVSAVANFALATSAIGLVTTIVASGGGDGSAQDWTRYLLALPFGRWLVALVGLGVVGTGLGTAWKGWTASFRRRLSMGGTAAGWVTPIGRAGYLARGLVFVLAGFFLVLAALHANAREVRGLAGTLRALQEQPYGWALLLVTALGLFAFGAFQVLAARYRRIRTPDLGQAADRAVRATVG